MPAVGEGFGRASASEGLGVTDSVLFSTGVGEIFMLK